MNKLLQEICDTLDDLGVTIEKSSTDNRTLTEIQGWNHPALTRIDLASMCYELSNRIKELNLEKLDEGLLKAFEEIPKKLTIAKTNIIPYVFNGHGTNAIPAYFGTMKWVEFSLSQLFALEYIDKNMFPHKIAHRVRVFQSQLDDLIPNKDQLENNIKTINDAVSAAESLPTDMKHLAEARKKIDFLTTESITNKGKLDDHLTLSLKTIAELKKQAIEAEKLVKQCEDAYRITTSKGLAGAFDQRADSLTESVRWWVFLLILALGLGAWIGYTRFDQLNDLIKDQNVNILEIFMSFFLSILSVGGSIWFAWIATKQIGYRFRLAEDYAYKASIAKAYEGYRKEAARIDERLEERLFTSTLTRLEEIPLRLMANEAHGSPIHEFMNSSQVEKALSQMGEVKKKVERIGKNVSALTKTKNTPDESDN